MAFEENERPQVCEAPNGVRGARVKVLYRSYEGTNGVRDTGEKHS